MNWLSSVFSTRVGQRLLLSLLLASFAITFTTFAWILVDDYWRGKQRVLHNVQKLEDSYRSSLSISLWNFDEQQLLAQMQGFLHFDGIEYVELKSDSLGNLTTGVELAQPDFRHSFELYGQQGSSQMLLGRIELTGSFRHVRFEVWQRAVQLAVVQLVKTLIISFVLLLLIHYRITRHLQHLGRWATGFSISNPSSQPKLLRPTIDDPDRGDELDDLAMAFERMQQTIISDITQQEIATKKLAYTHEQLNLAIENTDLGYASYRVKESTLTINHNFCRQLRTTTEQINQLEHPLHAILERLEGDEAEAHKERIYQLLQGRLRRVRGVFPITKFNGQSGSFDISFHAFSFHDNKPEEVIICCSDRTAEMHANEQLQQLGNRMELTLRQQREDFQHEILDKSNRLARMEREKQLIQQRLQALKKRRIFQTLAQLLTDQGTQQRSIDLDLARTTVQLAASSERTSFDLVGEIRQLLEDLWGNETASSLSDCRMPRTLIITTNLAVTRFILEQLVRCPALRLELSPEALGIELSLTGTQLSIAIAWRHSHCGPDQLFPFPFQEFCSDLSEMELEGNLRFGQVEDLSSAVVTIDLDG